MPEYTGECETSSYCGLPTKICPLCGYEAFTLLDSSHGGECVRLGDHVVDGNACKANIACKGCPHHNALGCWVDQHCHNTAETDRERIKYGCQQKGETDGE